jgi:hypothetical protein
MSTSSGIDTDYPYGVYTFRIGINYGFSWESVDDDGIEGTWDCADDYTDAQWWNLNEDEREHSVLEKQQEFTNSVIYTSYSVDKYEAE